MLRCVMYCAVLCRVKACSVLVCRVMCRVVVCPVWCGVAYRDVVCCSVGVVLRSVALQCAFEVCHVVTRLG